MRSASGVSRTGGQTGKSIQLWGMRLSSRSLQKAAGRGAHGKRGSRGPTALPPPPPPCGLCPSRTASSTRDPGRIVTRSSSTAAKRQGIAEGLGRLWWGRPVHSARLPSSRPAPASRPRPLGRQVGVRLPGPAHPAPLRGPPPPPAGSASPQLLRGGGCRDGCATSLEILAAEERASISEPKAVAVADLRGLFIRAPALPQPRVGRPRHPAASSRVRPPDGCSHVTGAGEGEPAHGEHLRVSEPGTSGFEGGRPGTGGGARLGVRGGPGPVDGGRSLGLREAGRPRGGSRSSPGVGGSGRGADLTRNTLPRSPPSAGAALLAVRFTAQRVVRASEKGGWGGVCPLPEGRVLSSAAPRSRRRAGVAAVPELSLRASSA